MDIRDFFSPGKKSSSSSDEKREKIPTGVAKIREKGKDQAHMDVNIKKKHSRKKRTLNSDSDEDPLPQKLRKTNPTKKALIQESDDDDDIIITKTKKSTKTQNESKIKKLATDKQESQMKPTTADDFFGSTPITQKVKPTLSRKRKADQDEVKKTEKKQVSEYDDIADILNDDDDDFEKSIQSLDVIPAHTTSQKKKDKQKIEFLEESPIPKNIKPKKTPETKINEPQVPVMKTPSPKKSQSKGNDKKVQDADGSSVERKKFSYASYKARDGPRALGSKEIPQGEENCLEGYTFVITGVLESIEREQASDLVKRHGGKITSAISKKTNYVIVGRDAGESKMDKARKFGTKQLDEDAFFDLIKQLPGKKSKYETQDTQHEKTSKSKAEIVSKASKHEASKSETNATQSKYFQKESSKRTENITAKSHHDETSQKVSQMLNENQKSAAVEELLWVDKYKPKTMKQIVGQQGDKSNAKKLFKWLVEWHRNRIQDKNRPKGGFFAGKEDGSIFKCALLSGPPGVGKTTTATLICKEAEFSFFEMNASDTRSKKTLQQVITEVLSNRTVDFSLQGMENVSGNHALIMDEVDGMAGNEDRGGIQELISLIKNTKIPIICMCNDRNHPKIRSLANYCFDLRFYKPRIEQIKGFAMSVTCKEGIKIPPPVMEEIVIGANQDIRQVLHNLQMWTSTKKTMSFDEAKNEARNAAKNIKMGPFDIVKKLFSASESKALSIQDKTDLFFNDYNFVPLFVQENYLNSEPFQSRGNTRRKLELMSQAADAIADSNMVERLIRGSQEWSLLPLQGFFSCVVAPDMMRGGFKQRIEFPQWLGKNSSQGKHDRILQELKTHMRLSCLANKSDINLEYLSFLRKSLVMPLIEQDTDVNTATKRVIELMDSYNLTREDWDSLMEIGKWGSQSDITASIPSKVKASFTRNYNKGVHLTPYVVQSVAKRKTKAADITDAETDTVDQSYGDDSDDDGGIEEDITKDSMIKVKKRVNESKKEAKTKNEKGTRKTEPKATGKGKGKKKLK